MGKLVRKTDTKTEESNLKTVESSAPVAAQGKSGRLVRTGTSQVEKFYTTTPVSTTRTKETTQNGRVGSGSFGGGRKSSADIGIGERVKNALSGAGKTYGAGFVNAAGTAYDALSPTRATQNKAFLNDTMQQYETAQRDLEAMLEDNGKKAGTWSENDIATQRNMVETLKQRYDAAADASDAQSGTVDEVYRLADEVANSGAQGINEAKRGAGELGQLAVYVGVAGTQMAADMALGALTGGSALPAMAVRSAGGAAQEARQEGATLGQQVGYGLASGALSVATEKIANVAAPFKKAFGGGVLDKAIDGALAKMEGSAAGKLALSFLSEGSEEMIEDLVQPLLQGIYNGKSIGENYSELDLEEVVYDGLIGGILGGIGGGIEVAGNRLAHNTQAQDTPANAAESAQERAETVSGETTLPATENAPTAQEAGAETGVGKNTGLDNGRRVSLNDYATEENMQRVSQGLNDGTLAVDALDRIYRTNESEHIDRRSSADMGNRKVNAFQFDHPEVHQYYRDAAAELLEELGYSEKGGEIIRKTSREAGDDTYIRTKRVASERIAQLLDGEGIGYGDIEKALNAIIDNHGQENFAAAKRVELLLDDMLSNGYRSINGETIAPNEGYLAAKQAIPGAETAQTVREELPIWDMAEDAAVDEISRETAQERVRQVHDAATALGQNGSRALSTVYDEQTARSYAPEDAVRDFYQVYNAALSGKKDSNTTAPDYIRMAAQNAGERDARLATQAKYFGENAQLVRDGKWEKAKLTSKQSYALDALAKVTGTEIRFADSVADGRANAEYKDGVITLALDAENPVMTSAIHETVHRIRESSPEMYQELAGFVLNNMSEAGLNLNLAAREALYDTSDVDMLSEEIVADAFGTTLENSSVLEQFTTEHRSAAQKLKDALHDLVVKIRRALGEKSVKLSGNQRAAFRDLQGKVSEMETLFAQALEATQGSKNAANEGGEAKFSIKMLDDGRYYVKSDRQVLQGNDPTKWGKQLQDYINAEIRKGNDIVLPTVDGRTVRITERSAYKLADDKTTSLKTHEKTKLSDENYRLKEEAASHIDEIVLTGEFSHSQEDIGGYHENDIGEDGFNTYTAYFEDNNGEYYRISFVSALNGDTEIAYSIGNIQKRKKLTSGNGSSARESSALNGGKLSGWNVSQNDGGVKGGERLRTKKYSLKQYTSEEQKQHAKDAISYFGKTYRWNETGYLTQDGTKLDFSGRHEGASGGYRTVDHRDIRDALGDDYGGDDYSGSMVQFMSEGNIRISPESGGIDLSVKPTKAQMSGLSDFISKNRGEVILNIDNENGQTVFSAEYPRGTHANKVLGDITAYFENGTMPQVSELAQFYTRDNYSLKTREALDNYISEYGEMPAGETPHRRVSIPRRTAENKYVSQTIRTVLEAKATPDALVPTLEDMVAKGDFSYDRYTDKQAVSDAESKIKTQGWQKTLNQWKKTTKDEVSKEAMATGWALYNNAATSGDVETAFDVLNDMVAKSRNAAQALQAVRLLKQQEPSAQLYGVQRSVENLQEEIKKKYGKNTPELKVDRTLAEKFLNAKTDETREKAMSELYRDIGRQMPSRYIDKWNAWRYLAMLGNPRTHVRNIVGNAGFAPLVGVKNVIGAGLESAANAVSSGKIERTKAILTTKDAETVKAAWNDYANIEAQALGEGKYSDSAAMKKEIEEGRVIFKAKPLEAFRKFNGAALDKEDIWFSKPHYAAAMAQYCKANGITAEQITSGKGLEKARNYAIREAQKATYRDTNAFSQMVSELGRYRGDNKAKKAVSVAMEGVLPFRKTPANILVRGVEYSPVGMTKAVTYDLYQVQKGNMEASEMLDHLSAGLTGTGVLALGVYMASQGLLRGSGGDDEDKKDFDSLRGHQDYALELPNGTSITLDWLAPEVLPLFVGANLYEQMQEESEEALTMAGLLTAISNVSDPLLEMSCLQSLNDLFDSVGYAASGNTSALASIVSSAATSYLTQALPTLLGQVERTGESIRMTTYTDKNKWLTGDMQYAIGKASSRLPIGDYNQIPYIDAWGRAESTGNLAKRAANNFLNPAYTSTVESSAMEDELERLYEATNDAGVLPERAGKSFTVNGERKNLTGEEYVQYATTGGRTAYRIITELTESAAYKALSDSDKADMIEDAYKVASAVGKMSVSTYQADGKIAKAVDAKSKYGISEAQFLLLYQEQSEVESLKDKNGDTITYSKGLQIMEIVYQQSGLSDRQRTALFEAFNVPESIRHYNKALVAEKLSAMRKSAK